MKVALVSPYDLSVPGGVQSHVGHLAARLRDLGDEVVVLGPGGGAGEEDLGRSVAMRFNGSVAPIALTPAAVRRTRTRLRDIAADVVHVHEPLVPLVGPAATSAGAGAVVATFHAWSSTARAYRAARPVGRRVVRHLDALVAVSPAAAGYHAAALGLPEHRFRIVPNGVDVARFARAEPHPELHDPERPTLLFVGRLEPRKGLEPLVRSFTELKTRRPELRLLVVGDGPEGTRCRALLPPGLRDDVVFLGRVSGDELAACYAAADVYVSPALGGESFGIVLLEAMAAGTPVVASDIPGYRTVVRDGEQGRLVAPGDPSALADAIDGLLDNPSLRRSLAAEGRRVAADHDWAVVAGRLRAVYDEVSGGGGAGTRP